MARMVRPAGMVRHDRQRPGRQRPGRQQMGRGQGMGMARPAGMVQPDRQRPVRQQPGGQHMGNGMGNGMGMGMGMGGGMAPPVAPVPPPAACGTSRRGPFTITSCPGKKTLISMTLKGFDIANMNPTNLKILEVLKRKVQAVYAQFLRLPRGSIVVEIKSGSVIIIGAVAPEDMPDDFEPGDGENLLAELKAIPGVEVMVEAGKQLDDAFVDPEPAFPEPAFPVNNDEAAAVGDPHLSVTSGVHADLCCDGGQCVACE